METQSTLAMRSSELESVIRKFIVSDLGAIDEDELDTDTNLIASGILDSMSAMRLVNLIETTLELKIPPKDLLPKNFMTVQAIVSYLESRN